MLSPTYPLPGFHGAGVRYFPCFEPQTRPVGGDFDLPNCTCAMPAVTRARDRPFILSRSFTCLSSSVRMEKKVLVSVGENTRVVTFSTAPAPNVVDSTPVADRDTLAEAVCVTFADILRTDQEFFLQLRNEDWGGVFVDMLGTEDVANKSVCRAVLKSATEVSWLHKTFEPILKCTLVRFLYCSCFQ